MKRDLVTEEELIAYLNVELNKDERCKDCKFTSIKKLREPDKDGCNWESANLRCSGTNVAHCSSLKELVIRDAREKVNLRTGSSEGSDS